MKERAGFVANKFWVFLFWGILASSLSLIIYVAKPSFIEGVDRTAGDARFKARGEAATADEVIIVAIDEKSVNELGRWPWPRTTMARLIDNLAPAKVVGLDIVFSEPETLERDNALGNAVKKAGNVVLGYFLREEATNEPDKKAINQINRSKIKIVKMLESTSSVPIVDLPGIETNIPVIGKDASGFGLFNIIPDGNDGILRRSQIIFLYKGDIYPSLALEALRKYLKGDVVLQIAPYGVDGLSINDRELPVDEGGSFQLNFYGKGGTFKTYSAVDIIKGRLPIEAIKGKIVFVGATEKGIYDLRVTPLDPIYPGVEVHATVAANVLQKRFLIHDSRVVALDIFFIIFLSVGLCASLTWVHRTFISLIIFLAFLSLHTAVNFYLFYSYNLVASAIYPFIGISLSYLLAEAYRNIVVESKGRYLKKAFGTYVSPDLVSEILKDPDRLKLGGEKKEITILFSDIRGFTSLSEKLTPEKLVAVLNEYLSPMTRIVLEEKGTLDKYIGDAIMVICNAPIDLPDHPQKGCKIAIRWIKELEKLNGDWKEKGYPSIAIGIGINTGDAVVGNMGADLRFDYTAIGDNVNLASRLEGMNKTYGTAIIVSESTQRLTTNDFLFRELDMVRVKGKETPVAIYELMDLLPGDVLKKELANSFAEALSLYKSRMFEEAKSGFDAILDKFPKDGPSALYAQRCLDCLKLPPPSDWDGVYVAKTK
ncbi:MAG: adenylate/guanylate cyclase domain-containing protein [Deltaproteobacteria bacterium]|nr:adenylate/guanylate cyclase domain-containing protein [Deltaproteobacteria bacterium]